MTAAVASEVLKLRTTRTAVGVIGAALLLVALIAAVAMAAPSFKGTAEPGRDVLSAAALIQLFALVLGILAVTSEFRHGTITPSVLTVPDRVRLLAAKLVANAGGGIVLGAAGIGLAMAIGLVGLSQRGIGSGLSSGEVVQIVVGSTLAAALWAALGVGIGALVRNQVGAIVGALAYVFVVEGILGSIPGIGDTVSKYGLNGVTNALGRIGGGSDADLLPQVPAGLLLLGYTAVIVVAGALALRRRDITA